MLKLHLLDSNIVLKHKYLTYGNKCSIIGHDLWCSTAMQPVFKLPLDYIYVSMCHSIYYNLCHNLKYETITTMFDYKIVVV